MDTEFSVDQSEIESVSDLMFEVVLLTRKQQLQTALNLLEAHTELWQSNSHLWRVKGKILTKLGQPSAAAKCLQTSLKLLAPEPIIEVADLPNDGETEAFELQTEHEAFYLEQQTKNESEEEYDFTNDSLISDNAAKQTLSLNRPRIDKTIQNIAKPAPILAARSWHQTDEPFDEYIEPPALTESTNATSSQSVEAQLEEKQSVENIVKTETQLEADSTIAFEPHDTKPVCVSSDEQPALTNVDEQTPLPIGFSDFEGDSSDLAKEAIDIDENFADFVDIAIDDGPQESGQSEDLDSDLVDECNSEISDDLSDALTDDLDEKLDLEAYADELEFAELFSEPLEEHEDTIQTTISLAERGHQIAVELCAEIDWGKKELNWLSEVLSTKGWSRIKTAITEQVLSGATFDELKVAYQLKQTWQNDQAYWIAFRNSNQAQATYKLMSWRAAMQVVQLFNDTPDFAEVQAFVDHEFDTFMASPELHRYYSAFYKYLINGRTKSFTSVSYHPCYSQEGNSQEGYSQEALDPTSAPYDPTAIRASLAEYGIHLDDDNFYDGEPTLFVTPLY